MRLTLNPITGLLEIAHRIDYGYMLREKRDRAEEPEEPGPFIPSYETRVRNGMKKLNKIRRSVKKAKPARPNTKRLSAKKLLDPVHPGEILLEDFMKPCDLTEAQLARHLRVRPELIKDVVNCKRGLTADLALRLARYFGTSPEVWLGLQTQYDLEVADLVTIEGEVQPRL